MEPQAPHEAGRTGCSSYFAHKATEPQNDRRRDTTTVLVATTRFGLKPGLQAPTAASFIIIPLPAA